MADWNGNRNNEEDRGGFDEDDQNAVQAWEVLEGPALILVELTGPDGGLGCECGGVCELVRGVWSGHSLNPGFRTCMERYSQASSPSSPSPASPPFSSTYSPPSQGEEDACE